MPNLTRAFRRHQSPTPSVVEPPTGLDIAPRTGPLELIRNRPVLVIPDAQNLDQGARRNLSYKISWSRLGETLDRASSRCSRHVILSRNPGDDRRVNYLRARGWQPHAKVVKRVQTSNGWERSSNADFLLAFWTALVVSPAKKEHILVIGSGDGTLVEDVAEAVLSLGYVRAIVTLSLHGSTAFRLNAQMSDLISGNIEVGRDCMRAIHPT